MEYAETRQDRNGNWYLGGTWVRGIIGPPKYKARPAWSPHDEYLGNRYETVARKLARMRLVWADVLLDR